MSPPPPSLCLFLSPQTLSLLPPKPIFSQPRAAHRPSISPQCPRPAPFLLLHGPHHLQGPVHGAAPGFPHRHTSTGSAQGERGPDSLSDPRALECRQAASPQHSRGQSKEEPPRPISCAAPGSLPPRPWTPSACPYQMGGCDHSFPSDCVGLAGRNPAPAFPPPGSKQGANTQGETKRAGGHRWGQLSLQVPPNAGATAGPV